MNMSWKKSAVALGLAFMTAMGAAMPAAAQQVGQTVITMPEGTYDLFVKGIRDSNFQNLKSLDFCINRFQAIMTLYGTYTDGYCLSRENPNIVLKMGCTGGSALYDNGQKCGDFQVIKMEHIDAAKDLGVISKSESPQGADLVPVLPGQKP